MTLLKQLCIHTLIAFSLILISFESEAKAQSATISLPANTTVTPGQDDVRIPINLTNNTGQIVDYAIEGFALSLF